MNQLQFETIIKRINEKPDILGRKNLKNFGVLVAVVQLEGDYHFLFQKRAKHIRQGSEISFPGGAFDESLDKTFEDTAIRETCEELGIKKEQVEILAQLDTFHSHVYIENFLGVIHLEHLEALDINPDEVEYVFTISIDYFVETAPEIYNIKIRSMSSEVDEDGNLIEYMPVKDLELPKRYHHTWNDSLREVYVYKTKHGPLWGLTAQIVYETVNKYFKE
ncbi:MAG: CoA pyrophosphatase [Clostridia bacterium]|nr:CoA pyrophosphatase [Clostridia bacterium]